MSTDFIYCSHCGHKNDLGEHFCANCGAQLVTFPLPTGFPPVPQSSVKPQPHASPPPQPSQAAKARKRGCNPLIIIGIVILGLLCCILVFFLGRSLIDNFDIGQVLSTPDSVASPTPVEMETLGNLNITSEGGTFQQGDMEISVQKGAVSEPVTLIIAGEKTNAPLPEGVVYQSRRYGLDGAFQQVNGNIEIKIKVPVNVLSDKQGDDEVSIIMEEPAYAPSAGFIMAQHPLVTQVDPASGMLTTNIRVESSMAFHPGVHLANLAPEIVISDQAPLTQKMIVWAKVIAARDVTKTTFSNKFFNLHTYGWIDNKSGNLLLDFLTEQKKLLETYNAQAFRSRTSWPINVYLGKSSTYLGFGGMGSDVYGLFTNSSLGINYAYIMINNDKLVLNTPVGIKDLKATLGHELFHMVQSMYDPRSPLKRTSYPDPVVWGEEALSTWFESKATGDESFLPTNASSNWDSIKQPMFSATVEEMAKAKIDSIVPIHIDQAKLVKVLTHRGYANSMFLRYLTKRFGDQLAMEILEVERTQPDNNAFSMLSVWEKTLKLHETRLEDEYPWYLEALIMNPKQSLGYADSFITNNLLGPILTAYVEVDANSDENNYILNFVPTIDLRPITTVTPHALKSDGIPAKAQIKIPLKNFSTFPFQFYFKPDAMTVENLKGKVKTNITISCTGNQRTQELVDCGNIVGMLLYYIPKGKIQGIISPTPVDYDTDGYFAPNSEMSSGVFSPTVVGPGADYNGLIFIPFNNFASDSSEISTIIIDIELYYGEKETTETFSCSCLDTIYPVGYTEISEGAASEFSDSDYLFKDKMEVKEGFMWNPDGKVCEGLADFSTQVEPEGPFVFEYTGRASFTQCATWAKCNGEENEDKCPYQH